MEVTYMRGQSFGDNIFYGVLTAFRKIFAMTECVSTAWEALAKRIPKPIKCIGYG